MAMANDGHNLPSSSSKGIPPTEVKAISEYFSKAKTVTLGKHQTCP